MTADHHAHDVSTVSVAILTVSSSRTVGDDPSGDAIERGLADAGHEVAVRNLVDDNRRAIRRRVSAFIARSEVEAVVTTGGTGLTVDDVTVEAVEPLFDREMPGFGEQFRARSVEEVGPHGMLSRATAGTSGGVPIFCLPGSEDAAQFGTEELIVPVLSHVVGLVAPPDDEGHGNHE